MKAKLHSTYYLTFVLFFIPFIAFSQQAQFGEVRGFVYDKKTAEPVIFTRVYLEGTTFGVSTDENGFYSITKIVPGTYEIVSSAVGMDTIRHTISVAAGQKINQNIYLSQRAIDIKTVNISADKTAQKTETKVSVTKVAPKQISQIPAVGGDPDLAQYLQVLPGVIFTGDQGGQLYIRGGAPIQNKVLLDGMVIYNPFHSIGLYSVFETDIIRVADVYTGGFGAEYGGRVSAVMDITTRDGNKKRFAGKVSTSPFTSKIILEGPLSKYEEGKPSISYLVSARSSYLEQTSKTFYSYVDTAGLPYNFTDIYGKVSLNGTNGSKFSVFGYNFTDEVNYKAPAALNWKSSGFGTNFVLIPSASSALIDGTFAYSGYEIGLKEMTRYPRKSEINGFNAALNFTYFLGKDELKYGVEMLGFKTDFVFTNAANQKTQQEQFTSELAGFVKYKYIKNRMILEPSFRLHYYASLAEMSLEPRFGFKYLVSENIRFKAAGGYYSQNLMSAASDRDVVNLFYGFLSGPDNLQKTFDGKEVTSRLQKARHLIAGFEFDLFKNVQLNVETYVKSFDQLTNVNRDKIYPDTRENADKPSREIEDFIIENGLAKGIDFSIKYEFKDLYIWTTYSLASVDRYDEIRRYYPHYDRRHNANLVVVYKFGKKSDWEIDGRWSLGSGFPFTQTQGFYEKLLFTDLNTDYTTSSGELGVIYADLNGGRLPWYHRLDMAVKKKWELGKFTTLEANAGVTNVYNRDNLFYFDRVTYTKKYQLPFLPSAGISLTF